jgi:hypothetical protein
MEALGTSIVKLLTLDDAKSWEQALAQIRQWGQCANDEEATAGVVDALNALNDAPFLSAMERGRRAQLILQVVALRGDLYALAVAARPWNAEIKNAVARFLPHAIRRLVYGGAPSATRLDSFQDGTTTASASEAPRLIVAEELPPRQTVLLFGAQHDHETNVRLLRRRSFDHLRVDRVEQPVDLLNHSVCGVVIAKSWWATLPPDAHRDFLERVLKHSTFTWIKMDNTGFQCIPAIALHDLCRQICFGDSNQLAVGDTCRVTEYDVQGLRRASDLISTSMRVQLVPADVRADESNVLLAATAQCVHGRHVLENFHLQRVPVGLVFGGRSEAKLFRVEPDDGGVPIIAKLDDLQRLRNEMDRFCRFVRPWDDRLRPCLQFHAGKGVIVFTLVDDVTTPGQPAPTLEDRLRAAALGELGTSTCTPQESDLVTCVSRAVEKLARLNAQVCTDQTLPSAQWLGLDGLEEMIKRGVVWSINTAGGTDALACRTAVLEVTRRIGQPATIHGDAHLQNVLVRDDREPHFIDYAFSGPGHPCFDLVRFESALFFQFFRMTADERQVRDLILFLLRDDSDESAVRVKFPHLLSSCGNRLAINGMIRSRNACLTLLRDYHGQLLDYLAVRYVVACQSLTLPHLQTGIVRASVAALADALSKLLPSSAARARNPS